VKRSVVSACIIVWLIPISGMPQTLLVGNQNWQNQLGFNYAGQAEAFQAVATASGTLTSLTFFLARRSTSTTVYFGLYADNGAGNPGTLLVQGSTSSPIKGAWNTIALSPVAITSGTTYWLALLGTGNTLSFRDSMAGSCVAVSSSSTTLTSLPSVWSTGQQQPNQCPVSGYGSGTLGVGFPSVLLTPAALSFGNQPTGTTSAPQAVTLTNNGGSSLTISSIGLSGTNAADFTQNNNCPSSISPAGTCNIVVTFSPTATGSMAATLSITDNASGSPQTVPLSGTGVCPSVTLNWDAPSGGGQVTGYNVYRGTTSGGETFLISVGNVLTYQDNTVSAGQTYYYEVAATGPGGQSGFSNEAMATVP
jgi:hypothetical protein